MLVPSMTIASSLRSMFGQAKTLPACGRGSTDRSSASSGRVDYDVSKKIPIARTRGGSGTRQTFDDHHCPAAAGTRPGGRWVVFSTVDVASV